MVTYKFDELRIAPLIIDAIYESGPTTKMGDEPLSRLLPGTGNRGGFRVSRRKDNPTLPAYIVLYSSLEEIEWPDGIDTESGVFRYYGDNRRPGTELHNTPKKGNLYLKKVFSWLNSEEERKLIPPFLVFKKVGRALDVQFLGIAAPGNINITPDRELNAIWRTKNGQRFQNYEAFFTILDTGQEPITKEWLSSLISDHDNSLRLAPSAWREFIEIGRQGIKPLTSPKLTIIPDKKLQLPSNREDRIILQTIREHYQSNSFGFEKCATKIVQMMDANFIMFELTRPWRDGGRDAIGKYRIGSNHEPLSIDCALEAKCYTENISVGIKQTSRLISRLKHRQFGVLVTTSFLSKQAYQEIIDDGHPVLIINARDIADILRKHGIGEKEIKSWLLEIGD